MQDAFGKKLEEHNVQAWENIHFSAIIFAQQDIGYSLHLVWIFAN